MQESEPLIRLEARVAFSESAQAWLSSLSEDQVWFAGNRGKGFFSEYSESYAHMLSSSAQPFIDGFFTAIGIEQEDLPKIRVVRTQIGSIEIFAEVVFTSAKAGYKIVQAAAKIPGVLENLEKLRNQIKQEFSAVSKRFSHKKITEQKSRSGTRIDVPDRNELFLEDIKISTMPLELMIRGEWGTSDCYWGREGRRLIEDSRKEVQLLQSKLAQGQGRNRSILLLLLLLGLGQFALLWTYPKSSASTSSVKEFQNLERQITETKAALENGDASLEARLMTIERLLSRTNGIITELGWDELEQDTNRDK